MENKSAKKLWDSYIKQNPGLENTTYQITWFGYTKEMIAELTQLIREGKKTAGSSAYDDYIAENEPLPKVGDYYVVLDENEQATLIYRLIEVSQFAFCDVPERIAFLEGEGDRTLDYWRRVHEIAFDAENSSSGKPFSPQMPVVCEVFEVVFSVTCE